MERSNDVAVSKYLSWVLRHDPDAVGLTLDPQGWVALDALVAAAARDGKRLSAARIAEVVARSDKQRFALSEDGLRIRAQQGHSVDVDLGYAPQTPPPRLFHGTVDRFVPAIAAQGLVKGVRHHVHLSADAETAGRVGARRGVPVVLTVRAGDLAAAGSPFFVTPNGVWLTEHVPPAFIEFPPTTAERGSP